MQTLAAPTADYARNYASLSNEELLRIAADLDSLTPIAQQALREELHARDLDSSEGIDRYQKSPEITPAPKTTGVRLRHDLKKAALYVAVFSVVAGLIWLHSGFVRAHRWGAAVAVFVIYFAVRQLSLRWFDRMDDNR